MVKVGYIVFFFYLFIVVVILIGSFVYNKCNIYNYIKRISEKYEDNGSNAIFYVNNKQFVICSLFSYFANKKGISLWHNNQLLYHKYGNNQVVHYVKIKILIKKYSKGNGRR